MFIADYTSWTNASHGFFAPSTYSNLLPLISRADNLDKDNQQDGLYQRPSFAGIKDSDLATLNPLQAAIWINGTDPEILTYYEPGPYVAPHVSFPFKRLASAVSNELTESYLFHQINETTLAEEIYVVTLNYWLPSNYITIANSSQEFLQSNRPLRRRLSLI